MVMDAWYTSSGQSVTLILDQGSLRTSPAALVMVRNAFEVPSGKPAVSSAEYSSVTVPPGVRSPNSLTTPQ